MNYKIQIVLALLCLFSNTILSQPIPVETARNAAYSFYTSSNKEINNIKIESEKIIKHNDKNMIAIFSFKPAGFVSISLNKSVKPVIAYSFEGNHNLTDLPENLTYWYKQKAKQISKTSDTDIFDGKANKEWEYILNQELSVSNTKSSFLINTLWGQGCYYNSLCPESVNGPCGHTVTGCVATAMAMIMKYWSYPQFGTGAHSYEHLIYGTLSANFEETEYLWDNMPTQLTEENSAVATIMYHCGVAVEMNYTTSSSGAAVLPSNFTEYFAYSQNAEMVYHSNNSDNEWLDIIKYEIDNLRPVLYTGQDAELPDGHAWICDGYDENDYLHFNWGWDNLGGFYELGTGMYALDHKAVIKIMPAVACDITVTELQNPYSQTFTELQTIKVKVENYSLEPITDIPISYLINNNDLVNETITETIPPQSYIIYEFENTYDFSTNPGTNYSIKVFTSLECDNYNENDTLTSYVENVMCADIPYNMSFSPEESNAGWLIEDANDDNNTWQFTPATEYWAPYYVYYSSNSNQANDWFFSKCLVLEENKLYKLSFDYSGIGLYWPQNLGIYCGNYPHSSNMYLPLDSIIGFNNSENETKEIVFTVINYPNHYIGFHCYSEPDNLVLSIDNFVIIELTEPDVQVIEINQPQVQCNMSESIVAIKIRNLCSQTLSNIPVAYSINGENPVEETISETILPGEYLEYQFLENADFSEFNNFTLKVYTAMEGDINQDNDTITLDFENIQAGTIPYFNNFDDENSLSGYLIENTNQDNKTWYFDASSGNQNTGCMRYDYNDFNTADDWFFTKCIYLHNNYDYTLEFYHKVESNQWSENLAVHIGRNASSLEMEELLIDLPNLTNMQWEMSEAEFSVNEEGFYYIGFYCYSAQQMFNLYVDEISIDGEYNILSEVDNENSVSIYPNPAEGFINILINKDEVFSVELTDLNGRIVLQKYMLKGNAALNLQQLKPGIYFIKIKTQTEIINRKFIRE
jgi:hypothetical protein